MKLRAKYSLSILLFFIALMVASCSAPAYRQNKYKKNNRYHNSCGCMVTPTIDTYSLALNEQK